MPTWMYSPFADRRLQRFFREEARWDETVPGGGFHVPSERLNLVFVLLHIYRHFFTEGVGLRQLLDYFFVLRNCSDASERQHVMSVLKSLGVARFTAAVMWVLAMCFRLEEEYMLCPPDEVEGRFLLIEVMKAGNFGQYDSYVEANMVAPEDRIQAQLSAKGTPCIGIGISGNRCVEYNHLMNIYDHIISNVHTNILLIADISDILPPNKTTDFKSLRPVYPFRKIEGKLGFLSYRLRLMAFRNILKKTEICFRNGLDFTGNHWRREKTYTLDTSSHKQYYEAYWRDMLNTLKISSNDKKLLIVYVPIVPRIQNNAIITEDKETEIFKQFDKVSHEFGLVGNGILNLEKRFCDFTLTTHQFPRGFFNTCPGEGHLNADGHRIVAEAIIEELLK